MGALDNDLSSFRLDPLSLAVGRPATDSRLSTLSSSHHPFLTGERTQFGDSPAYFEAVYLRAG